MNSNSSRYQNDGTNKQGKKTVPRRGHPLTRRKYRNVNYGYTSMDLETDTFVIADLFNKSQEFFAYFIIHCDSHRFCEHIRVIAASKIKELSGTSSGNEMLKQFEQRYLHIRILGKFLGFLESSVFWFVGLEPQFRDQNISDALGSYIRACTDWVEDASRSVDVTLHLKTAWSHGSLISTVPWLVEYLKPLKFDIVYSRGETMKGIVQVLWCVRNFSLQNLESRAGLLIVACIDKLLIQLKPLLENASVKEKQQMMSKLSVLDHFKPTNYGSKSSALNSTVLDMQEGLVDDSVFKKSFREFEFISLLFSERNLRHEGSLTSKQGGRLSNAEKLQNRVSKNRAGASNAEMRTPLIKMKRDRKYKLTPTNIQNGASAARKNLCYWFYEKHEVLKELTDMILDRCVKNSIKAAKDLFLDVSFHKITSKHAKFRTGLAESFDAEEADLLRRCFRYAQQLCKADIERSILALAPAKYFHWNKGIAASEDHVNLSDASRLPTHTLSTCIELAIDQGTKHLKQVIGDSVGAEFRKLVNGWEKKHRLRSNTTGGKSTNSVGRNIGDTLRGDKSGAGMVDTLSGKDDGFRPALAFQVQQLKRAAAILLLSPNDETARHKFAINLKDLSQLLSSRQNYASKTKLDGMLLAHVFAFIHKNCLFLAAKLFHSVIDARIPVDTDEETFDARHDLLSCILNFVRDTYSSLLHCSISTTSFGRSLLNELDVGIGDSGGEGHDTNSIFILLANKRIIAR